MSTDDERLKVYYNSACPVCRAGIHAQKDKSTACEIEWADVHSENDAVDEINQELSTVRKYLHVKNARGELMVGIDAFIALWEQSPKQIWMARLFSLPLIRPIASVGYKLFAHVLYAFNRLMRHW